MSRYKRMRKGLIEQGGFSVGAFGGSPRSGYMVSTPDSEEVVEGIPGETTLQTYYRTHATNKRDFVGGWVNDGRTYLDISQRYADRAVANDVGDAHDQLAVYDVAAGASFPVQRLLPGMFNVKYPQGVAPSPGVGVDLTRKRTLPPARRALPQREELF